MAEQPPVFSHDVKIEQSAKGARVTVHVFANDADVAMNQAIELYEKVQKKLAEKDLPVAPIEVGKGKD